MIAVIGDAIDDRISVGKANFVVSGIRTTLQIKAFEEKYGDFKKPVKSTEVIL